MLSSKSGLGPVPRRGWDRVIESRILVQVPNKALRARVRSYIWVGVDEEFHVEVGIMNVKGQSLGLKSCQDERKES